MDIANKEKALAEWLEGRPDVIKNLAGRLKPWNRYRIKDTGQHCTLEAYSEDGTVKVVIDGHDSQTLDMMNKHNPFVVFGIKPGDLEVLK